MTYYFQCWMTFKQKEKVASNHRLPTLQMYFHDLGSFNSAKCFRFSDPIHKHLSVLQRSLQLISHKFDANQQLLSVTAGTLVCCHHCCETSMTFVI